MGIIHVLDMSVANLIAAGEVVERPASAVKELVENAMDAGAHTITVEIKRGGVSFLRVTDDGCGMSDADAVSCLQRHATSKIKDADDLARILALGFRGEALAAISSVTDLRILTRLRGAQSGTLVHCEYGKVTGIAEGGYPEGTTVICEGLFAHVPARLQFLKSDQSEGMAVMALMEKMAVSHPEIAFRFIADEQSKFHTTGDGNLKNAIYAVYGREFAGKMTEVSASSGGITVSGFISTPEYVRGNRHMELFFINSRLVSSKTLIAALENAYTSYIPVGKFPACVMFLKLHASAVDVNVHPSKAEVKFHREKEIFDAVYYSVRGALEAKIARPALDVIKKTQGMTEEKWNAVSGFTSLKTEKPEQLSVTDVLPEKKPEPATPVSSPKPEQKETPILTPKREAPEVFAEKPLHAPSTFDYAAGMTARVAAPTGFKK
ncbi:MAG: DNA mismatch repair endonuclease MutL, partial [Ruminococcus sp.]|nr:DNA mismatch repair endonuclease MutL [Candidatus Apopatosoma intestinale]